ncbi:hypothetical protein IP91_00625 [Pseudoduganella lurida]|uniref:Uncharacterized protein n=1 Tax=Pseudoduganella lurida TaxID=1036180 RepID=A0A562RKH9_9BURK|nr:glycine zipper domain-containing protein [Pseudoduganella lurida]TWI69555.1 hypothetical protein IP91_00625 [Pseudoduganella lurida]
MFNHKRILGVMVLGAAVTVSSTAFAAGDRDFNTAAGAVLGAAIGSQNGGGGALVGGLVGAAVGNAVSSDGRHHRGGRGYVETRVYAQPQPVYYEPAPVYYAPAPRYVQPATVYVEPRRVYRDYYYDAPRRGYDRYDRYDRHDRHDHHHRR